MVLLPEGFALPPLPHLVTLLVALAAVGYGLYASAPAVTERHVLGLAPWMAVGSCLHVLHAIGVLPSIAAPFAGTPAVYLTVAAVAGATWLSAAALDATSDRVPETLAGTGLVALVPIVAVALRYGAAAGTLELFWPTVALLLSVPAAWIGWIVTTRLSEVAALTGRVGALAMFGHGLDGVSTAVGIDVLGYDERTPLSQWILEGAAALPGGVGGGWLFVLVKLAIAGVVVSLFGDYVREEPAEGYLMLGFVAAVGLGPGAHNLLLFAVTAGA